MQENKNTITVSSFWSNLFKTPAERDEIKLVLTSMPPFKELSSRDLDLLLHIVHNRVYAANEFIFNQGDPGIGLYIIQSGEVRIEKQIDKNQKYTLAVFNRGDFFGEIALLDDDARSASAIAAKDSKLAVIFKPDLDEFVEKYPKKGIKILQGISQIVATRLRNINQDFITLYFQSLNKQ
ncbi:MAG: cyclic nucleotide-binding domain-containing protein [Ignavibacteriales bacterium]|nr:cyclic nucleotide-binding domain-containing protein [Ignavibacteriales bacterium]